MTMFRVGRTLASVMPRAMILLNSISSSPLVLYILARSSTSKRRAKLKQVLTISWKKRRNIEKKQCSLNSR